MYFFNGFLSEVLLRRYSATPPFRSVLLLLQTNRGWGEVLPGCGSQSGAAPVIISISFHSWRVQRVADWQ
jgi:hypothetical protein